MTTSMTQYNFSSTGLSTTGHKIKAITQEEYDALIDAVRDWSYEKPTTRTMRIADRDKLIMRIMYECGTRISSTLLMDSNALSRKGDTIRFVQQKKRVHTIHEVSITPALREAMLEYMARHTSVIEADGGLLFKMARDNFTKRLRLYSSRAGITDVTPHSFRHGCAMKMLRAGVPINVISYRLGHSTIEITAATYARITPDVERSYINHFMPEVESMEG